MGAVPVVVVTPCRNQMADMAQGIEQVLVGAFVAHSAIESFHKTILHRLAGSDVVSLDLAVFLPLEDGI